MRNQWRFLLRRSHHFRSLPEILTTTRSTPSQPQVYHSLSQPISPQSLFTFPRFYSSDPFLDPNTLKDPAILAFTHIFEKPNKSNDEINQDLVANKLVVTRKLVLEGLKGLFDSPDVAKRAFDWVLENDRKKLTSKSYNLMVGILGSNGFVEEFWEMVGVMKEKGYGIGRAAYDRAFQRFEKDGLTADLEKLKEFYVNGATDNSVTDDSVRSGLTDDLVRNLSSRVCWVIRSDVWGDENQETRLKESGIVLSSELVASVIENIGTEQNKGLIFFRWVEESNLFKHDERTYNAMARVLGKDGGDEKFWKVMDEMRSAGYEIERGTYVDLVNQFVKKKMLNTAVALYEFAMSGNNKPSVEDSTVLLKEIVVGKELDIDLFAGVVKAFTGSGNVLKDNTLHAVLKSLASVGRIGECNKVLKVLQEGGYQPSDQMKSKIAYQLTSSEKAEELSEFMNSVTISEEGLNPRLRASLVKGYCAAGDMGKAAASFKKMIKNEEGQYSGFALASLVDTYCCKNRGKDAYKIFSHTMNKKQVRAKHRTFKILIKELLAEGFFKEAVKSLNLMKMQRYHPSLDPFIKYLPEKGTADDATTFLEAVMVIRPSTSTFLRVFEAYFKAGKHSEAQDFLLKCPKFIKNNAEVLNLFYSNKAESTEDSSPVAA